MAHPLVFAALLLSSAPAFASGQAAVEKQQAQSLYDAGNFPQALAAADSWSKAEPSNPKPLLISGLSSLALGDGASAKARFEQALKASPAHPDALNNLGLIECRQGRSREAYALFDQAAVAAPTQAGLPLANGAACAELWRDGEKAKAYLSSAMAAEPSYAPAYYQMAQALYQEGSYAKVDAYIQGLHKISPPSPDSLALAALAAKADGNTKLFKAYRSQLARMLPSKDLDDELAARAVKPVVAHAAKPARSERESKPTHREPERKSNPTTPLAKPQESNEQRISAPVAEQPASAPPKPQLLTISPPTPAEREARIREARESSERVRAAMGQAPSASPATSPPAPAPAPAPDRFKSPQPSSSETLFEH